jgi:hypothetical protein
MRERHGIEVEWANEALRDPEALRIDPDFEQEREERSYYRLLAHSRVPPHGHHRHRRGSHLWRQWMAGQRQGHQAIQRGVDMSSEIQRLVAEEAAASEANPDAPIPATSTVSRPNRARSTVYSIRLNPEEVAEVQALADAAGVPPSTLVRSWIIERMQAEHGETSDAEAELRAAQRHLAHLERHLRQHAS